MGERELARGLTGTARPPNSIVTSDAPTPDPRPETPDPVVADWLAPRRFALVLAALLAVTFWRVLFGGEAFFYRDYGFLGYPFAHFHRECFWSGDLFPLWNPYVNCGAPFLAQWNTLCLYPGALIYLLLPLPWSLGFFCVAHLFLGGMGMRALAERWTGSRFGAAVAGVAFVFSGLVLGCVIYPNYLVALGWMPWVALATRRAWREGGRAIVLAALSGAMQMLSGAPEIILLTWAFLAVLAVADWVQGSRFKVQGLPAQGSDGEKNAPSPLSPALSPDGGEGDRSAAKAACTASQSNTPGLLITNHSSLLTRFLSVILLITALCAAQLLPFFQLLSLSQRSGDAVNTFWSLPGWGWVNLFFPLFMNFQTEQGVFVMIGQSFFPSVYLGIVPLTMALLAVWRIGLRRVEDVERAETGGAFVAAVPPHPGPLPPGEGERQSALGDTAASSAQGRATSPPLLGGEGRGEGEGRSLESSAPNPVQMHPPQSAAVWEVRLLAGATLLAVLLAMGDNFVLWRWLREVLPLGVMRFPVKALLLAAFTVPLLAAWGMPVLVPIAERVRAESNPRTDGAMDSLDKFYDRVRALLAAAKFDHPIGLILWLGIVVSVQRWLWPFSVGTRTPGSATGLTSWMVALLVLNVALLSLLPRRRAMAALLFLAIIATASWRKNPVLLATIPAHAFQPGLALAYHADKGALTPVPKLGESRVMLSPLAERALHTRMVPKFFDDFIGQRLAFWGNLNLLDGLPKVNGASTLVTREWNDVEYFLYGTTNPAPANLMDFLGVTHTTKPGELMQWERRETAMPLVSAGQKIQSYDDASQSVGALLGPSWQPRETVLIPAISSTSQTERAAATARVRHFQPPSASNDINGRRLQVAGTGVPAASLIEIEAEAAAPTVVVIAQNFYPSWRATVNGQPAPVLRANHAFQAIPIPAGKSTIRLDYVDWPFRVGAVVSLATLLGCVVLWRRARLHSADGDSTIG